MSTIYAFSLKTHLQAERIPVQNCHPERSASGSRRDAGLKRGYRRHAMETVGEKLEVKARIGCMKKARYPYKKSKGRSS
jgi:hypothetical protein